MRSLDAVTQRRANGVTFRCFASGPVTIFGKEVDAGQYFSVRIGRELYATAVLKTERSTFRISRRCEQR